ncbi:hypothetical protein [Actinomadura oligospora]|uniref:hypothetical protein n=1 Tax=Actinomadura oligospora TaxID=111804 RepID=UPI0004B3FEBB|nr:hypothetical protein [Actinomadura oligospora]
MIIVLVALVALFPLLMALLYLVEFARESRRDALFGPADSRSARRARRVTGMYVRGAVDPYAQESGTPYARGGDEELVGR